MAELDFRDATEYDAEAIAALHRAAADGLTTRHGRGVWSGAAGPRSVLNAVRDSRVLCALEADRIVGALTLGWRKPWAIDPSCFAPAGRPLYLTGMVVDPACQRRGVGRALLRLADDVARDMGADQLRLDAWDAEAGAGGFYARCGWEEVGRRVYRGNPILYFQRRLRDGAEATPPASSPSPGNGSAPAPSLS